MLFVFPSILHLCSRIEVVQIHQKTPLVTWKIKSGWPGSFSSMRRTISEWQISFPGALWVLFQGLMSAPANKIILSLQFVRSVSARPAGLQDFWRSNTYKTVVTDLKKKKGGKKSGWGARLWSQVVAPAHARCGFYCLLMIARLLHGRIYWSRQPAWLLSACGTLVRSGRRPLSLLGPNSLHAAQRYREQLHLPLGVKMDEAQLRLQLLDVQQEGTF